jgi:outer membrane protein assembly factor BamB
VPSVALNTAESARGAERDLARSILEATGLEGGLIVHLGCGDGKLTAALRQGDGYLVHGLDTDADTVRRAREHVRSLGAYGGVSVDRFDGKRLPYVDGLVNLVVSEDLGAVGRDELMRVLAPGGALYVKHDGAWTKSIKPRPTEIDEWTHFLYDASNNAVSHDAVAAPPSQLQWVGGPRWARSHDHLATVSAVVSSGGRIFSIVDEAPIAAVVLEPKWRLVARDAFSGVILWKRPIPSWQYHLRGFRSGPSDLSRRLVAVGDRVYVTLGIDAPLSALDAATGKTTATYQRTDGTLEVVYDEGSLFVVAGEGRTQQPTIQAKGRGERRGFTEVRPQRPAFAEVPPVKRLTAINAADGRLLWEKSDADTAELMPTTLAVSRGRAFFQNADELLCVDASTGETVWRAERPTSRSRPTWSAPTLVVYGDVILSADRAVAEKKTLEGDDSRTVEWIVSSAGGQAPVGELIAFSAEDGRRLWSCPSRECYNAPIDVLVAGGLVWTGELVRASEPGITEGRDPKTGEVRRTRPNDQEFFAAGMGHGRCHRNRATDRYLVLGRSGVEFIDVATGVAIPNHWTRGTCQYGVMPANGLVYAPPHSCACFTRSKLDGYNCFAPKRQAPPADESSGDRLERGIAYERSEPRGAPANAAGDDWPTYRHDGARSGSTPSALPARLEPSWHVALGGKLSSVVVADGKLLVAQVDAHTVHALDAKDGRPVWSFTAGGRVDSPPTVWQGRALFGSADGSVYCLRASDGALAWRFRAAPADRRITAYGQIESVWPIHGSVLVQDGVVYCAAGRSSYLDGGIRLVRLDAVTGRKLSETIVDHRDPKTGYQRKGVVRGTSMPGALPDVLSCDGQSVYMRHSRFDLAGQPQEAVVPHLYSPAGFLDDAWWHRTYWLLGATMATNYGGWPRSGSQVPAGRLLALDDASVYGFGRDQYIHHGAHVGIDGATVFHFKPARDDPRRFTHYRAFAVDRRGPASGKPKPKAKAPARKSKTYRWTESLPILARSMVLTPSAVVLAGPPDVFVADDPHRALEGAEGGSLIVLSAADGGKRAEHRLESPPVFDGMAAARGRLYLADVAGSVLCFAEGN